MASIELSRRTLSLIAAGGASGLVLVLAWLLVDHFGWASALLLGILTAMVAQRAPMTERDPGNTSEFTRFGDWIPSPERPEVAGPQNFYGPVKLTGYAIAIVSAVIFARQYF